MTIEFTRETYVQAFIGLYEDTVCAEVLQDRHGNDPLTDQYYLYLARASVAIQQRWAREGDGTDLVTIAAQAMNEMDAMVRGDFDSFPTPDHASAESRWPDDGC